MENIFFFRRDAAPVRQQQRKSSCNFLGRREKRKKRKEKPTSDKSNHQHRHASLHMKEYTTSLSMTRHKGMFLGLKVPHGTEVHGRLLVPYMHLFFFAFLLIYLNTQLSLS